MVKPLGCWGSVPDLAGGSWQQAWCCLQV